MELKGQDKREYEQWLRLCDRIRATTRVEVKETAAEKAARIKHLLANPAAFMAYYFPKMRAMDAYIEKPLRRLLKDPTYHGWWRMFRGAGKTTILAVVAQMMLMQRLAPGETHFLLLVAANDKFARRLLGNLQAQLQSNERYIADFGHQVTDGHWRQGEFVTQAGHVFVGIGMEGASRGMNVEMGRPTMILATDLDSKELSRNPTRCKEGYDWLMEDVYGTFGADSDTTRFVYDNNYFSTNSIGHLIGERNADWDIVTVNATDAEGNPTAAWITPAKIQQWKKAGHRAYMRNYMNTPIEEGNVFKAEWVKYKKLPKLTAYQKLVAYFDPSLSEKKTADFKAIRLWGSVGEELHCIRTFCRQCSIMEAMRWMHDLYEWLTKQGVVAEFWIESQFWNEPFQKALEAEGKRRGYRLPLRRDDRKKPNKETRIESMTGLYEQGTVYQNAAMRNDPDTRAAEGQLLAFGPGSRAHDDAPDADEGAWHKLLRGAAAIRAGFSQGRERDPEYY